MKYSIISAAVAFLLTLSLNAQVSFTGVFTENFNSMGTSGTAAPSGWGFYGNLGGSGTTWASSIPAADAGLGTLNATLVASTASTSSNTAGYNWATTTATADRALGTSPTSGRGVALQLSLTNASGAAISTLRVRYDIRRFIVGSSTNELPGYWLFYSLDGGTSWTNVTSLNPTITNVPNTTGVTAMVETSVGLSSSWATGSGLLLRWIDDNANQSSPDQIIGLDNVSITTPASTDRAVVINDGQHVTMGSASALGAASFTLECWFKRTGTGTTTTTGSGGVTAVPLVAKGRGEADGTNQDCNYFLGINQSNQLTADFEQFTATNNGTAYGAGQNFPVVGSTTLSNNLWYHVAATYDTTTATWKLFVNGVEETVSVPSGSPTTFVGVVPRNDSIQHFAIGTAMTSTGAAAGAFQGIIDEVRVWNYARSGAQIAAAKDTAITTDETGLLGRYGLNEGSGTSTAGNPATAPAGTLAGTPLWTNGFSVVSASPPNVALTSPSTGTSAFSPGSFTLGATATDTDGSVTQVEFLRNGTVINTDTTAPYSFADSGLQVGSYSYTARATDNSGLVTTSSAVNVTVTLDPGNLPANTALWFDGVNDYVTMGTALDLGVGGPPTNGLTLECWFRKDGAGLTSSSGSGGVTAVPLFGKGRGEGDGSNVDCNYFFGITTAGILVADFEAYPATGITSGQNYPITGTNTPITNGVWNHAAVTYDGATATWTMYLNGTPVGTATAVAGALPRYDSIQHFGIGTAMNSTGVREGAFHGIIDEVRVWNYARSGAEIAATKDVAVTSSPGLVARYGLNEGIGTTTASSTGTSAGTLTNGPLWIEGATLVSNDPPTVAITAPANNATFNAPAAFTLNATASDPDGTISKVEFYIGATKLGEDTTAPYSFDLSGLAQGSYSYTARATDNFGAFANSSVINVTVEAPLTTPPTVSITAPADGATFLAPATILINANAADSDGTVAKVEFFNGATKLGEDMTSPYSFAWNNVAIGTYSLTAKATDDMTATTTSAVITVNVIANQAPTVTLASPADLATNAGTGGTVTLSASVADPESQPLTVTFYGRLKSPPVGPDFTLVTLPDTQFYSENNNNRLTQFTSQTNWIVANRTTLNIPFVAHMGDMVQNGDAVQQEWINADSAMDIIEDPLTTLLTHGIPWGGAPGNHDQQPIGSPDGASAFWNTYFGSDRWAGRPYWGGNYSTNNDNNYQLFSASGLDFIIINLEYRPSANQAVLDWADALLKAHPNRRAIITSHWLIGTGNPAAWGGHGQAVYDNLKDNPNLFLMLCGHIHGEGQRADVFEGRTVYTVLQDYQSRANGGDSWLRYFVFSPANNTITAKTLQTRTLTFETDADSEFTLPYTMGAGTAAWTALGTVNASGGSATLDWTGLAGSTEYEWYAAVSDGTNNVGSTARSFTTAANAAPTVSLTSPTDGASVVLPAQVAFEASAADSGGSVAKVEFFAGTTKVGEDSTAPFSFAWTAISGSYALTAVATDNQGASTTSDVVNITVTNPANVPPTVSITSPVNGFSTENSSLTISATAADTDGAIAKVEFFQGATKLGEDTTSPFAYNWSGVVVGTYSLTAIATDNDGATTTSTAISVIFTPPGNFLGSYTQNFDSVGTAGTTPPGTWSVWNGASGTGNSTWTTSVSANGVAAMVSNTSSLAVTTTPSGTNNNGFNAAASTTNTADRALASSPTSVSGMAFQLLLTNGTGSAIRDITLGYDTIRYTAVGTANELPGYWVFYSLDGGTTWTNISALNPTISNTPNTVGVTNTPAANITLATNWAAGSQLLIRWVDDNAVATSPDNIFGLDNVSITASPVAPALTITAPASDATSNSPVSVAFNVADSAPAGSVQLSFGTNVLTLAASQATLGAHSFSFDPASPTASPEITSGSAIPDGLYTVTLSYLDASNAVLASASTSNVRIDTTAPTLTLPAPITAEATSAAGAAVIYTASASDLGSGVASSSFSPTTGSIFALGNTTVNALATDNAGNQATGSFSITVQDTTAPVITQPVDIGVPATSEAGAVVTFPAPAISDAVGIAEVTYSHASGSTFPIGTTTVTVTARDAANNSSTVSFNVSVLSLAFTLPAQNAVVKEAATGVKFEGSTAASTTAVTLSINGGAPVAATLSTTATGKKWTLTTALGLLPGTNSVIATATDGTSTVSTAPRTFFYEVLRTLTTTINPVGAGTVSFSPALSSGKAAIGRSYTVTAKANKGYFFDSWSGKPAGSATSATFTFAEGDTVVAGFEGSPFTDTVAGLYNGIVKGSTTETDTQANAGLFSATITKDTGAFTGKLILDGTTAAVAGVFNDETNQFTSPALTNGFVTSLTLDIANAHITGTITKMKRGNAVSIVNINAPKTYSKTDLPAVALTGAHNVAFTAPVAPLTLLADEYPRGSGYGVLTISSTDGASKFAGVLADGTAFTSSSVMDKTNQVPVYAAFASGIGSLVGNATIDTAPATTDVTGTGLRWFRRANSGQYYPWGYESGLTIDLIGAKQVDSTQASLGLSSTPTVEFSGGPFAALVSQLLGTATKGFLSTDKATSLSFSSTGLMTGSHTPAGTTAKHVIKGIIVGKPGTPGQAYGHILTPAPAHTNGTGLSGKVEVKP